MPNTKRHLEHLAPLYPILYEKAVRRELREDLGRAGDITTDAIALPGDRTTALIVSQAPGRIAGMALAACAFHCLDPGIEFKMQVYDGEDAKAGDALAVVQGFARPILSAERTALNYLAHLSGIATCTRSIVERVSSHAARVVCTRKTTPGFRALEKYAVRAGGGANHRFGLDDAILIKDNHVAVAGGVTEAIQRARRRAGHMVKIEVEVDTLQQLELALTQKIDAVLLDNMPPDILAEAVRITNKRAITEASGGITPETAEAVAATGVDLISIGWMTHSSRALTVSMNIA
jgi:nicotinate-nucleotide pyrophosphorylase (carboxylating)